MKVIAWYDLTFGVGLATLTVGLSLWSLPLGIVVLGLVLCAVGARGAALQARRALQSPPQAASQVAINSTSEDSHGLADQTV